MDFLKTANNEKSSTKLLNTIVTLAIMAGWAYISYQKGELVPLDMTLLGALGVGTAGNSINKWVEANATKAKAVAELAKRLKK